MRSVGCLLVLATGVLTGVTPTGSAQTAEVQVRFSDQVGPMEMNQMGLGQGGLSDDPMWADRVAEIRSLHPKLIRLFVQEYFDLLPQPGQFHFDSLDRSVATILAAGAKPLLCLCFKPGVLFPKIDQDIVEPQDYSAWEELVTALVKHYQQRRAGIEYWEIGNEPDIGEDGGCPYRFKPDSYVRYYQRTAAAILRADPGARVGGPALASPHSAILPALLSACETNLAPLHFVSWHIYNNDPLSIRRTVEYVQSLLKEHPNLKPETILDEWNMDLVHPPPDSRFQPAFICETIWQMKEARLDYSCYYHIRDFQVDPTQFEPFMSARGAAFMARWWNRMPQFDGLFDYQNHVRPSFFAFKLLSRCAGGRVSANSNHAAVHAFASHDERLRMDNLLIWNFSSVTVPLRLTCSGLPAGAQYRHLRLTSDSPDQDENSRLRPDEPARLEGSEFHREIMLAPYSVEYWAFE